MTEVTQLRTILETALAVPLSRVENPSRDQLENWDSLTHIEIVFMVEEAFDVRFSEEEIAKLRSLEDFIGILQVKHAT